MPSLFTGHANGSCGWQRKWGWICARPIFVGKFALIQHQRYAHAKQFKRAGKALRKLKTYLDRVVRDIERRIAGDEQLDAIFKWSLYQAKNVIAQRQRQRGRKI
jgi:transposase, IS5 family